MCVYIYTWPVHFAPCTILQERFDSLCIIYAQSQATASGCMYVCMYVCMYLCVYVFVLLSHKQLRVDVCMYVCMHVCISVYV